MASPAPSAAGSRPSLQRLLAQEGCCVASMNRSGCGISPKTRPVASHTPATSASDPLGLVLAPVESVAYRSTRCPADSSRRQVSGETVVNRPSPWATGSSSRETPWRKPQRPSATCRWTHRSTKRPLVFAASVACGRPSGPGGRRSPVCMSTWKPLQMPRMRPPRSRNISSMSPSRTRSSTAKIRPLAMSSP